MSDNIRVLSKDIVLEELLRYATTMKKVYEDKDWIVKSNRGKVYHIQHKCGTDNFSVIDSYCFGCGDQIPSKILTIRNLANKGRIG